MLDEGAGAYNAHAMASTLGQIKMASKAIVEIIYAGAI